MYSVIALYSSYVVFLDYFREESEKPIKFKEELSGVKESDRAGP